MERPSKWRTSPPNQRDETMAFNLTIVFGGLCMFVQRDDTEDKDKGLYVLMPATHDHGHGEEAAPQHCPMLIVPREHDRHSATDVLSAIPDGIDLRKYASTAGRVLPPARVLNVTTIARRPVDASCFAEEMPACMAQRVVLPLGASMIPFGDQGRLDVPTVGAHAVTGYVQVTFEVTKDNTLTVGAKTLVPVDGEMFLVMLNVPIAELQGYSPPTVAGDPALHVDAYYPLLTPSCTPGSFHITHTVTKPGGIPPLPRDCPTDDEAYPPPAMAAVASVAPSMIGFRRLEMRGVDPNNCTIGYGCTTFPCP